MYDKINNQIVDLNKLSKGYISVDLHCHTKYSDGVNTVEKMLQTAKDLGIGLAITDHNEVLGSRYAEKLIKTNEKYKDILLIPGIEVSTKEGDDFLFYFSKSEELLKFYTVEVKPYRLKRYMFTGTTINVEKLLDSAKNYDCLMIAAHPFVLKGFFSIQRENTFDLDEKIQGYEAINSGIPNFGNSRIQRYLSHKTNPIITAGSDAHSYKMLGTGVTCIPKNLNIKTAKDFIDAVRSKNNIICGKTVRLGRLTINHMFFYNFILNKIKKSKIFRKITN
ncbi:PHP domain-containing protein [Candidatus Woesearchaeota archaeon]|nr:PHP domain-containing protein [Candidatus Woesearchaeota archaeon]